MGHNTYKAYLTLISNFYKLEVEAIENNINIYHYIHHVVNPLSYAINDIENTDYSHTNIFDCFINTLQWFKKNENNITVNFWD